MRDWAKGIRKLSWPDINKNEVARTAKDLAEGALGATGTIASKVAAGLKEGVGLALLGAKGLYQRGVDDHAKWREIVRINMLCEEMEKDREKRREDFVRDFEKEQAAYNELIPTINEQLMKCQLGLELLMERETEVLRVDAFEEGAVHVNHEEGSCGSYFKQNPHIAGGLTGASIGAGTVGLMTLFGSAGTGTALSSLTGVAYIKATLAALGGGPLYLGGAGMMGGAAVLGAAVLAPATAVTGYLADKNINEEYPKAKEREERELQVQEQAEIVFRELDKGIRQFRRLSMELYSFSGFFEEMLNMSVAAAKIEYPDQFFDVLRRSAKVLHAFTTIRILHADNELNTYFAEEFENLQREEGKCREQLDIYRRAVDPERQELLDRCKQDTDALNRELKAAYEKLERVEASYQAYFEEVATRQPEKMEQIVSELANQFHAFGRETLLMLATGEFDFRQKEDYIEQMDFGGIAIEYGKSIERILTAILLHEGIDMDKIKTPQEKEPSFFEKINAFCLQPERRTPQWVQDSLHSARQTRNIAAHQKVVRLEEARNLRSILFGVKGNSGESLLTYLHQQLC